MMSADRISLAALLLLLSITGATPGRAVITLDEPGRRVAPQSGPAAHCGWQYEGEWGAFLGTAIAPHFFLTAKHVGGAIGQAFQFQGRGYTTVEVIRSPDSDLAVWRVEETLPTFAPLFTGNDEVGRSVVVFGRGTARGIPITIGGKPRGWRWGDADHAISWGRNVVVGVTADPPHADGATPAPHLSNPRLIFTFDARDGAESTCHISTGDSGGGIFTPVGDTWQLAGIVWGFAGGFAASKTDSVGFNAALFDCRGFYLATSIAASPEQSTPIAGEAPVPGEWYATRVSGNQDFLRQALATGARPPLTHALPPRLRRFTLFTSLLFSSAAGVAIVTLVRRRRRS